MRRGLAITAEKPTHRSTSAAGFRPTAGRPRNANRTSRNARDWGDSGKGESSVNRKRDPWRGLKWPREAIFMVRLRDAAPSGGWRVGMRRGDIYLVSLDPTLGHEQQGSRPVVVVSATEFNQATSLPVVCPITSGGDFARRLGFAVPISGIRTTGIVPLRSAPPARPRRTPCTQSRFLT